VEVVAADAEKEELLRQMLERFPHPASPEQHPVGRVFQTGESVLLAEVTDSLLEQASLDAEHLKLIRRLAPRSSMIVPLVTRGRILGAMTLTAAESDRGFGPRDLEVAEELARRAALAVDNARNHQRATRAVRTRDEVLGVVAHDLRNPLSAIDMYANLLEDALPPGERNREHARSIRTLTGQANRLIEDLLNVSRLEAGALRMEVLPVPAVALVDPTIETLSVAAVNKGIALDAKVSGNPPMVLADPDRISQVLSNLIGNSLKFTPTGGRITVRVESRENEVHFSVSDDGPGIPPEHLSHIFDRFWQAKSYSRSGAGLGLSIVKGIVEAHGGRVWAESEVGRGSTFSFALPIVTPREGEPEPRWQRAPGPGDRGASSESATFPATKGPLRVLVVDDHPAIRRGLAEVLRTTASVEVVGESSTGEEALEMVGRLNPDVVLMDLEMPGMGGIEAIRALHSRHPEIRVIALTANSQEESLLPVLREGGSGFVRKSDAHRDLVPALAAAARDDLVLPPGGADLLLQGYRARRTEMAENPLEGVSEQERTILGLAAEGFTSREIGKKLFLSPQTVDTYRSRSMRQLGLSNRSELVRFALRNGLLAPE
jgi:signal transduction histidine kinase/DNA-binding NarL/FixJ family response regulator